MSMHVDIHSQAFEQLLAEALRAGPGSPQWQQAVAILREAGTEGEEFAVLCQAREDLESGKKYRSIHAGPGFTRKLMDRLENEKLPQWSMPTASIVVYIAIAVVVIGASVICWQMVAPSHAKRTLADLQDVFCVTPVEDVRFENAMPEGFKRIGLLPVEVRGGLVADVRPRAGNQTWGGGVYREKSIPDDMACAIEMSIEVTNPQGTLIPQLFISDEAAFSPDKALSPRELVCLIEAGEVRVVLPDGRTVAQTPLVLDAAGQAILRIKLTDQLAIVEHGGKALWSGEYHMAHHARYVGVRYLTRGGDNSTGAIIRSLRIMKP